jgi:hypothetical protein
LHQRPMRRRVDHADRIAVTAARCRAFDRFARPTKLAC